MVTTRAGAKRNAIEALIDVSTESMKRQLIGVGVISAKKCPNDRLVRLLYEKHCVLPSKRQKYDRDVGEDRDDAIHHITIPSGRERLRPATTQDTPPETRPVPPQERLPTESAEPSPSARVSSQFHAEIVDGPLVDDRDSESDARITPTPSSPHVPVRSAHEKGKGRMRSVAPPSDGNFDLPTFETPRPSQVTERGAHPSTRLPSTRRYENSKSNRPRLIPRATREADDVDETEEYAGMEDEDKSDDIDKSDDEYKSDDDDEMDGEDEMDEDETVDEDSDTPPSRQKTKKQRVKPTRQRQGQRSSRRTEEELPESGMIPDPTPTVDVDLLQRENARLRQIIVTLQSTFVGERQETQNLNQNLQTLTGVVGRLVETSPQTRDLPQSARREKPPRAPRGGSLARVIAGLMKTLFGQKKEIKILPTSATAAEMRLWRTSMTLNALITGEIDLNPEPREVIIPVDPNFPYPEGPGNEKASPVELRIIWRTMQQAAVSSFRPNFRRPINSPENALLWRVAAAACVRLIRCGEIQGLTEQESDPKNILSRIKIHAKETLYRKYRQQQNWSVMQLESEKKRKVRYSRWFHIKQARESYALSRNHLWPLTKAILHCTSDDETDVDATPQTRKVVKVRNLEWRNPELEKILVAIDNARERRRDARVPAGAPPTIRTRGAGNPYNNTEAPTGLNIDCYCPNFLEGLSELGLFELDVNPQPILGSLKDLCDQGLI